MMSCIEIIFAVLMLIVAIAMLIVAIASVVSAHSINRAGLKMGKQRVKLDFLSRCLSDDGYKLHRINGLSQARIAFPDSKDIHTLLAKCEKEADSLADSAHAGADIGLREREPFSNALVKLFRAMCIDADMPIGHIGEEDFKTIFSVGKYYFFRQRN